MPYSAGTAYLTVIPSFLNIQRAFEREAKNLGKEFEKAVGESIPEGMREAAKQAKTEGEKAGDKYAGAFADTVKRRLTSAIASIPKIEVDADTSPADRALAQLRQDLETLRDAKIGVDLDEDEFFTELARLQAAAAKLERDGISVEVRTNAAAVRAEIEALLDVRKAARLGNRFGDALGDAIRRRVTAAIKSIPDPELDVRANTSSAERDLQQIRRRLVAMSELSIDVDFPPEQYLRELAVLERELEALERDDVEIRVRTNARAALAEIRALREFAEGPAKKAKDDGDEAGGAFATAFRNAVRAGLAALPEVEINANSTDAQREIAALRSELNTLSAQEIGVNITSARALADINRIEARLRELSATDVDIDVHTNLLATATQLAAIQAMINRLDGQDIDVDVDVHGGIAQLQLLAQNAGISMSRLGTLISLGAAVGTAIVPAAAAAAASISAIATAASSAVLGVGVLALGLFGVVKAVGALDKFQKDSDKSASSLAQSQDRVANALDSVRGAQRSLARAERERRQAVDDLVRAQEDARRQLEDMALAARDTALAQRQATLDAAQAKRELDKVLANPRATLEEREQAKITYESRVLQLDELAVKQKRLAADKEKADKAGVNGSEQVLRAQERIADATEGVISAQEQLAASNRALAQAYTKTGIAGGEALDNLKEAMDALSPAGQRFALFIFSLKDEFKGLQAAAEGGLLPGLEQAIRNLLPILPSVERLVGDVAKALGNIFVDFTKAMDDPVWQRFFGYLADTAAPTLEGMAEFAYNVLTGIFGILNSLTGFNAPIGEGLLKWSEGFAEWSRTLDENEGWQRFLGYVREVAPVVIDFFESLWDFTKKFVAAAAPIGAVVLKVFDKLFQILASIDTDTWTIIIAAIAGIGAALLVVSAVTAAIGTGIAGAIIAAVAVVAAGLALLYTKVEPIRVLVDSTIAAVGAAGRWLWEEALKPAFDAIGEGIKVMRDRWNDLYQDIFVNVFGSIGKTVSAFWETLKTVFNALKPAFQAVGVVAGVVFGAIGRAVEVVAAIFNWLWDHVLRPVFQVIGVAFNVLGAIAQVAFGLIQIGVKIMAAIFGWLWDNVLRPIWEKIKPFFVYLADVIEKHVVPPFKRGMEFLGKAWDIFVENAKRPIRFVIETILNDGLLAGYNKIAKAFKVKPDDVRIDLPKGFRRGGAVWGAGTATSDSIPALLSNGEHVWTAREVEAVGGQDAMYRLRQAAIAGALPRFAGGGAVGDFFAGLVSKATDVFKGIGDFLSDPLAALKRLAEKLLGLVPEDSHAVKVALGMPRRAVEFLTDKVKGFFGATSGGPSGAGPGFLPWPPAPWAQRGDSGVWRNILQLVRDSGIPYNFGNAYRHGDPLWHGSGRAIDFMGYQQDALGNFFMTMRPRVLELIHTTNQAGYYITRGQRRSSMGEQDALHRNHLHIAMDSGGLLTPGWNPPIWNGTGRPEPVLTGAQWDAIMANVRGGDGGGSTYNFEFRDTTLDPGRLRAIQDRETALARVGRAR